MKQLTVILVLIFVLLGCTNKTASVKQIDNEPKEVTEMKKKITVEYLEEIVKKLVVPQFESIDTLRYRNSDSPEQRVAKLQYKKDKYDSCYSTFLILQGWVFAKVKNSSKQRYDFSILGKITEKNIDNPYEDLSHGLTIWDKNDVFIYSRGDDPVKATAEYKKYKKMIEEEKSKEIKEKKAEQIKTKFAIEGITVEFFNRNGGSYHFKTEKELNPAQIIKAINTIGGNESNKMQYIVFFIGDLDYASYVYKTQCIIYSESGAIYKVTNGNPVLVN